MAPRHPQDTSPRAPLKRDTRAKTQKQERVNHRTTDGNRLATSQSPRITSTPMPTKTTHQFQSRLSEGIAASVTASYFATPDASKTKPSRYVTRRCRFIEVTQTRLAAELKRGSDGYFRAARRTASDARLWPIHSLPFRTLKHGLEGARPGRLRSGGVA